MIQKRMHNLILENRRLRARNRLLAREMNYLLDESANSPMRSWEMIEAVQDKYLTILNPAPVPLKGDFDGEFGNHKIEVKNVVAIKSEGKYKRLFLKENIYEIPTKGKTLFEFKIESSWDKLLKTLDSPHIKLFKIHKSWCINIEHFKLKKNKLTPQPNIEKKQLHGLILRLSNEKSEAFREMEKNLKFLISFQKMCFRSLLEPLQNQDTDI